jgi:uncharacterized YigZ family protein
MDDLFYTIKSESQGFFSDKGSKFISFAFPVASEDDVKENLQVLKKKYYDARHYVYAFIIGSDHSFYRASDDGEPANSSGMPVLGQIRSFGLTNVLIVVVRYFGGTKLGVPGLINAYKNAAKTALENAQIIEQTVKCATEVEFDYEEMNFVMKVIKDYDAEIKMQDFQQKCKIVFLIRLSLLERILDALKTNHKLNVKNCNE